MPPPPSAGTPVTPAAPSAADDGADDGADAAEAMKAATAADAEAAYKYANQAEESDVTALMRAAQGGFVKVGRLRARVRA